MVWRCICTTGYQRTGMAGLVGLARRMECIEAGIIRNLGCRDLHKFVVCGHEGIEIPCCDNLTYSRRTAYS